ncbi:MAG: RepB family DNA primase [Clostridiales bacterium]|jgi:putative DNA primase/helicase|nr:RepB family DNA primase [Clostridiales bacterium]
MNSYTLSGINVPPEEFLRPFFGLDERICLRAFSDKPDSAFSGQKLECTLEGFSDIADSLRLHNKQQRGVYFVINYGGHEDADISRINAQFMEMDNLPLEEQLAKIQAFQLEPSLIVKTRKSLHCYWLVKNAKKDNFRHIQKQLVAYFGSDPACINESRVFRLPGFYHHKEDAILVECIKFNPELRYTQDQLGAALPEIPK